MKTGSPKVAADNRASKRDEIVTAAVYILRTDGISGCTVRAIASAVPIPKSAIHYYFNDVDEIVQLAYKRLLAQLVASIKRAAESENDPVRAFWSAITAYLRPSLEGGSDDPPFALITLEYESYAMRRGRSRASAGVVESLVSLFEALLANIGADNPAGVADVLESVLIGEIWRSTVQHRDLDDVVARLARVLRVPGPEGKTPRPGSSRPGKRR